jgi:hypothetical protein
MSRATHGDVQLVGLLELQMIVSQAISSRGEGEGKSRQVAHFPGKTQKALAECKREIA